MGLPAEGTQVPSTLTPAGQAEFDHGGATNACRPQLGSAASRGRGTSMGSSGEEGAEGGNWRGQQCGRSGTFHGALVAREGVCWPHTWQPRTCLCCFCL